MTSRIFGLAAAFALAAASALALPPEPANLQPGKQAVRAYVDSGDYLRGVAEVAERANHWIEDRVRVQPREAAKPPGKAPRFAVVFDVDETLISNLPSMLAQDFGYVPAAWDAWVAAAKAPALEPVRLVYETARRLGVAVIILTGRREHERAATDRNLRAIGCGDYAALVCEPDEWTATTGAFKLAERRRLAAEGFVIVANLGDQESDFSGGEAERDFRLPNPFYITE